MIAVILIVCLVVIPKLKSTLNDEGEKKGTGSGGKNEKMSDNDKDIIYCQEAATPAWANEPGNKWRVFRYYGSREISDFAHVFYTRLGTNILVHALTQ